MTDGEYFCELVLQDRDLPAQVRVTIHEGECAHVCMCVCVCVCERECVSERERVLKLKGVIHFIDQ